MNKLDLSFLLSIIAFAISAMYLAVIDPERSETVMIISYSAASLSVLSCLLSLKFKKQDEQDETQA